MAGFKMRDVPDTIASALEGQVLDPKRQDDVCSFSLEFPPEWETELPTKKREAQDLAEEVVARCLVDVAYKRGPRSSYGDPQEYDRQTQALATHVIDDMRGRGIDVIPSGRDRQEEGQPESNEWIPSVKIIASADDVQQALDALARREMGADNRKLGIARDGGAKDIEVNVLTRTLEGKASKLADLYKGFRLDVPEDIEVYLNPFMSDNQSNASPGVKQWIDPDPQSTPNTKAFNTAAAGTNPKEVAPDQRTSNLQDPPVLGIGRPIAEPQGAC